MDFEQHGRLFYVYRSHSGEPVTTDDKRVIGLDPLRSLRWSSMPGW